MKVKNEMFGFLFKNKKLTSVAHDLFGHIMDQSREPVFYKKFAVADNLDGRFDLMALHMAIVIEKINHSENKEQVLKLKQILQEIMFDNLDLTMREIGVGDMGVGKKVKAMAEAFYGRMKVYKEHLNSKDHGEMADALSRNLYRENEIDENVLSDMTTYAFDQYQNVLNQNEKDVFSGVVSFTVPDDE